MGLDASVRCNCYREGLATTPPVPAPLIVLDRDGWFNLDMPYDGNKDEFRRLDEWVRSGCTHPDMVFAHARVAGWDAYRVFREALGRVGWARYPTLRDELPELNGGTTEAAAAVAALDELADLRRRPELGRTWYLVDEDTDEPIAAHTASDGGTIVWDGGSRLAIGIDPRGLFVVSAEPPARELFRAMRVEQRLAAVGAAAPSGAAASEGPVELVDLDSGARVSCSTPVPGRSIPWPDGRMVDDRGRVRTSYPRRMRVEPRTVTPATFDDIVSALEGVFRAAIITGNAVRWC
jgi:hypothetical protein